MTLSETLKQLKAFGNAKVRALNAKSGAAANQFGVSLGDIRKVAKKIRTDWLIAYVVRQHPDKEALRRDWMTADDRWAARAGWDLTAERVAKSPEGLDVPALLSRLEAEMADADPEVQWTMNNTLATIGIHFPKHRKRALAIGEKIGLYRDWPVSKGCTPPSPRSGSISW